MVLKLRPKLAFSFGGYPGCHAFFSPKFYQNSQPTYSPRVYPQKPFRVSYNTLKKIFSQKFSTKTPPPFLFDFF